LVPGSSSVSSQRPGRAPAGKRVSVEQDCASHGLRAGRGRSEELASDRRSQPVAEADPRYQVHCPALWSAEADPRAFYASTGTRISTVRQRHAAAWRAAVWPVGIWAALRGWRWSATTPEIRQTIPAA
jgi:hypothetical protein